MLADNESENLGVSGSSALSGPNSITNESAPSNIAEEDADLLYESIPPEAVTTNRQYTDEVVYENNGEGDGVVHAINNNSNAAKPNVAPMLPPRNTPKNATTSNAQPKQAAPLTADSLRDMLANANTPQPKHKYPEEEENNKKYWQWLLMKSSKYGVPHQIVDKIKGPKTFKVAVDEYRDTIKDKQQAKLSGHLLNECNKLAGEKPFLVLGYLLGLMLRYLLDKQTMKTFDDTLKLGIAKAKADSKLDDAGLEALDKDLAEFSKGKDRMITVSSADKLDSEAAVIGGQPAASEGFYNQIDEQISNEANAFQDPRLDEINKAVVENIYDVPGEPNTNKGRSDDEQQYSKHADIGFTNQAPSNRAASSSANANNYAEVKTLGDVLRPKNEKNDSANNPSQHR